LKSSRDIIADSGDVRFWFPETRRRRAFGRSSWTLVVWALSRYNLIMSRSVQDVLEDVRRLPPGDLDWLIGEIFQSGDGSSDTEIDAAWKTEVERRVAESEPESAVT
jgi:hypothetical protein